MANGQALLDREKFLRQAQLSPQYRMSPALLSPLFNRLILAFGDRPLSKLDDPFEEMFLVVDSAHNVFLPPGGRVELADYEQTLKKLEAGNENLNFADLLVTGVKREVMEELNITEEQVDRLGITRDAFANDSISYMWGPYHDQSCIDYVVKIKLDSERADILSAAGLSEETFNSCWLDYNFLDYFIFKDREGVSSEYMPANIFSELAAFYPLSTQSIRIQSFYRDPFFASYARPDWEVHES